MKMTALQGVIAGVIALSSMGKPLPRATSAGDGVISVNETASPATFAWSLGARSVPLGGVVNISVDASGFPASANGTIFWPFVNGSQWGSFVTCAVSGRDHALDGGCTIMLPLPVAGLAAVRVAVLRQGREWGGDINATQSRGYPVGTPSPSDGVKSNGRAADNKSIIAVAFRRVKFPPGVKSSGGSAQHDVCMDWEPWHTSHNANRWMGRAGASAMPLVGMYGSFNEGVIRQHAIWLVEAGVTCIEIDWSNSLWGHQLWSARGLGVQELSNATALTLHVYAQLRAEGHDTPKALFMVGLQNGPPATPSEVGNEAGWIRDNLLRPLGAANFVALDGKPLLLVLLCGVSARPNASVTTAVSGGGVFTVRFMATQLQENPSLGRELGFWSWMDGSVEPVPTLRPDGSAEALTVTPAFFAQGGWLGADAMPQNRGATFVSEMATAIRYRPSVLLVCQWNEWLGQGDHTGSYEDAYNISLTNDMEPTALAECGGYQHAEDAGQLPVCDTGWGFFNLNLLSATLHAYRESMRTTTRHATAPAGVTETEATGAATTVVRISEPPGPATHVAPPHAVRSATLRVAWAAVGPATRFHVALSSGTSVTVTNASSAVLDLSDTPDGVHTLTVSALDGVSAFTLQRGTLQRLPLATPLPATDKLQIELRKPSAASQTVSSVSVGFTNNTSPPPSYEYGASILQENGTFYSFFCSPGGLAPPNNSKVTAWDVIRMSTSHDGKLWTTPSIVLEPSTAWDHSSVCDPSIVQFRGTFFLYHTCINTCNDDDARAPPDGYHQNRICVALADHIRGPWRKVGQPVIQDLSCAPDAPAKPGCAAEVGAYCVGQPSAVVVGRDEIVVFYSSVGGVNDPVAGPNPGRILAAVTTNGVDFVPRQENGAGAGAGAGADAVAVADATVPLALLPPVPVPPPPPPRSATLFTQRDVDIRFDRVTNQLLMLQGDVGSAGIFWSLSGDAGMTWLPWSANRTIAVDSGSSCNHNPGLAAVPDGTFGGRTIALVASAFDPVPTWGRWHLWRTDVGVGPHAAEACSGCAPAGCDHACSVAAGRTSMGECAAPNSTDPGDCCRCESFAPDMPCLKCAAGAGGCVELCRSAGHQAGMCKYGDGSANGLCCECFP